MSRLYADTRNWEEREPLKIMGRTQMLPAYPILESLDVIRSLGFDGVEICVEKKDWSWVEFDDELIAAVRAGGRAGTVTILV